MAAKQAEDEDDDIFGDFTFASSSNPNNSTTTEDDDGWGDFVATTSPQNQKQQFQSAANNTFDFSWLLYSSSSKPAVESTYTAFEFPQSFDPPPTTKPIESKLLMSNNNNNNAAQKDLDPLGFSSIQNSKPFESNPPSTNSQNFDANGGVENNDSGKNLNLNSDSAPCVVPSSWEKLKGAIPLSIFGDEEEEEEEEEESADTSDHLSNGAQGLFPSKSLPTMNNLGLNIRSVSSNDHVLVNLYGGEQAPLNRSISNVVEFSNGYTGQIKVDSQSKLNVIQDLFEKNEQIKGENGSKLNVVEDLYGTIEPVKVESATQDLFGTSEQIKVVNESNWNSIRETEQVDVKNGFYSNSIQENGDLDEEEWEFKDAAQEKNDKDGDYGVMQDDNALASWEVQTEVPSQVSTKTAMNGTPPNPNGKIQESTEGSLFGFSNTAQLDGDWFVTPEKNSYSPTVIDNGFHSESGVSPAKNPESLSQPHIATENGTSTDLSDRSFGSDESFGDFMDASPTEALKFSSQNKEELKIADQADNEIKEQSVKDEFQGNNKVQENGRGALPLSIFSDGNVDSDEQLFDQDMFSFKPTTSVRNGINSQLSSSNLSLNDLIKDMYTRVENVPAVGSTSEHTENDFISPHTENGFIPPQTGIASNSTDMEDDFEDTSWEFKAAFTETNNENSSSVVGPGYTHQHSSESRITSFADFYSRLKEKAGCIILHHLDDLKNAKKEAALFGEDAKVEALHEEIQTAYKKLLNENMAPQDDNSKEHKPKNVSVNELLAAMEEPIFQVIELEYHLSQRISLAKQNLSSALWLFEHAISVVKILNMGSVEDISNYSTTWSRMTSVCARELKHGAFVWKQALEKNVLKQMVSEPEGKRYILALGEIYRVVEVLRVSATFYKPWILSSLTDPMEIFALLEECKHLWSNFGINKAIQSLSDAVDIGYDGSIKTLLESIMSIHDLDVLALQSEVSFPEETCMLSLLSLKMIPGMKMVLWNGKSYFLTLANFWANLVSPDPPKLPQTAVYS